MIKRGMYACLLMWVATTSWAESTLRISTTTSTDNSGLFTVLHPAFEAAYDIRLEVIAVGTGKALKMGARGDADVVFVHAPAAELDYVKSGDFIDRKAVMHNDFVLIGAASDPAKISAAKSAAGALQRIATMPTDKTIFVSRGDNSGTHKKELQLWQAADIAPEGIWYWKVGQGMGAVLTIADEKQVYTMTDRGTYLAYADKINLSILFEGDISLSNPYHVMAVNPAKHPHVQYNLAQNYIDFITGPVGQQIINNFKIKGQQLFYGDVKP
jgi:tungstate transport system substrate-binding protein